MNSTALLVTSTLGWVGALGTMGAYALVAQGRLEATSTKFHSLNVVGGGMLAISAGSHANWPSAASNILWTVLGLYALFNARHVVAAAVVRWSQRMRPVSARRPAPVDIVDRAETVETLDNTEDTDTAWGWSDSRDDTGTIPVIA